MENKKSLRLLIFISVFISTLGISPSALAYGVETHAYLTDEAINFYNQNYSNNPIKDELKSYIVDGARREDDTPRWMNHFYDPVNNSGLNDPEWGRGFSSKGWAQSDSEQTTYAYKPISYMASILTASEQGNVNGMDLNFTWNQAIRYYRDGDVEKAMFALGHVIHLIEDASVPDHTRNDAHPHPLGDGSPYEEYTEKFTRSTRDKGLIPRLSGKKPIDSHPTLSSYFDEMAKYSNNNFYSEDTIESSYSSPNPDFFKKEGKYNIAFKKDEYGIEYRLYVKNILSVDGSEGPASSLIIDAIGGDKIVNDYWSRLSTKSVQVSAGVIKLFFDDVERVNYGDARLIKDDRNPITWAIDNARAFAQIISSSGKAITSSITNTSKEAFTSTLGNGAINNEKLVETIDVKFLQRSENDSKKGGKAENTNSNPVIVKQENSKRTSKTIDEEREIETEEKAKQPEQQKLEVSAGGGSAFGGKKEIQQEQVKQEQATIKVEQMPLVVSKVEPSFKECSFGSTSLTTSSASYQKVIINEVAWMGGSSDFGLTSADEWIELKNISSSEINISNWQLIDKAEQVKINLGLVKNTKIKAGQFILLERTDDDSAPNIAADLIYSNTLNNSDEGLRLFDNQCNLVDEVIANPNWPAGDNAQKRTMERDGSTSLTTSFSWHTYSGTVKNSIFGTPKKENSISPVTYNGVGGSERANYSNSGSTSTSTDNQQQTTSSTSTTTSNDQQQHPSKILISEVQITPIGNRFIELYNPNSFPINLTNWYLQRKTQTGDSFSSLISKTYFEGKTIDANSYFLISRDILENADIILDSLILTASNTIQLKNSNGEVIDKVGWGQASDCENNCAPEILDNQSIQRKFQATFIDTDNNVNDFEIQTCPSPKAQSRSCPIVDQTSKVLLPLSIVEVIYDLDGSDDGKELVRLSNPNSEKVKINDYSLQYLGSDGDFTKIKKKNFEAGNKIPTKGIFKIGMNCHDDAPCEGVDLSWRQALNNSAGTVFLVSNQELLTGLSDSDIIHGFHYPEVTLLTEPSDFVANYDSSKLTINLSWNANPSLVYQIQEYNSPGVTIFEGKGDSFSKRIDEVGKNYKFSIKAFNENAEHTQLIEKEITVPSFVKDIHFYKNLNLTDSYGDYLIEANYASYPFVADLYDRPDSWKLLVFYLNSKASDKKEEFMPLRNGWEPVNKENVLRLKYQRCSNSWQESNSMILPDASSRCHTGDNLSSSSLNLNLLEDPHFKIGAVNPTNNAFSPSDYMTIVYYSFYESGGGEQIFKLVAADDTKYYFQNTAQIHSSPTTPSNLEILSYTINSPTSTVQFSFNSSIDFDSIDSTIQYERSLDGVLWQPLNLTSRISDKISANISLELGGTYNISIRAVDDFGNLSEIAIITIILPPPPPINLIPDPSNDYFAIDDAKLVGDVINVKWRLIKNPAPNGTFGIIPFIPSVGISSDDISNSPALHRDYDSNFNYPYLTANSSNMCNSAITPVNQYVLGWQYQTNFSSINGITSPGLLGKEINFGLYIGTPCNPSDNEDNPIFSDYPIFVKN